MALLGEDRLAVLQAVQELYDFHYTTRWSSDRRSSTVVFIGEGVAVVTVFPYIRQMFGVMSTVYAMRPDMQCMYIYMPSIFF